MSGETARAEAILADRASDWLAAVARRRSRRAFDSAPLDGDSRERIAELCACWRPYPDARAIYVERPVADVFTGIVGSYGKMTGAPHLLVLLGEEDGPYVNQHVGFTGQAIVLEAEALGLATCWIGGSFSAGRVAETVPLETGERVFAVSPLGYAAAGTVTGARARPPRGRKRVAELVAGGSTAGWPGWAVAGVETARFAPSALNRQPWRFRMEGDGLVLSAERGLSPTRVAKRLDIGIAMLHVELACRNHGVIGRWTDLDGRDVARFDPRHPPVNSHTSTLHMQDGR